MCGLRRDEPRSRGRNCLVDLHLNDHRLWAAVPVAARLGGLQDIRVDPAGPHGRREGVLAGPCVVRCGVGARRTAHGADDQIVTGHGDTDVGPGLQRAELKVRPRLLLEEARAGPEVGDGVVLATTRLGRQLPPGAIGAYLGDLPGILGGGAREARTGRTLGTLDALRAGDTLGTLLSLRTGRTLRPDGTLRTGRCGELHPVRRVEPGGSGGGERGGRLGHPHGDAGARGRRVEHVVVLVVGLTRGPVAPVVEAHACCALGTLGSLRASRAGRTSRTLGTFGTLRTGRTLGTNGTLKADAIGGQELETSFIILDDDDLTGVSGGRRGEPE